MPAAFGVAWAGWPGLAAGALAGALGLAAWATAGRAPARARAKRFVLRSHGPPAKTPCGCCGQTFDALEPAFSCVDSGTYVHARCRRRHAHEAHAELVSA
ncbi:MAG: hypothetical protein KDD82_15415 [Planctomycetes bacterium]|nr:hypothetical protein [Planctomycetota bacterium]